MYEIATLGSASFAMTAVAGFYVIARSTATKQSLVWQQTPARE